jgi:DNA-binding MarR family transcriptional regulator
MTSTESLESCPFRDSQLGYLLCKVSPGRMPQHGSGLVTITNLTNLEICQECPIPQAVQQVNCLNLSVGKQHTAVSPKSSGVPQIHSKQEHQINCSVFGFENSSDFEQKCSISCPSYRPIHKNLISEERISINNFDATEKTDRQLRQAILAILYKYHAQYPERFGCSDITPQYIAESLGLEVSDIVRVVAPMEEEGEVTTQFYSEDMHFRYVTIRSKGIRMIDDEPLFERLNTKEVRTEMNFHGPTYCPAGTVQGSQSILEQD